MRKNTVYKRFLPVNSIDNTIGWQQNGRNVLLAEILPS